jgi:pantetheine-phosphate adenylyltransferase
MKVAVFPGSFDPFTKGHESVVSRGADLFDKVIIAIGTNTSKKYFFDLEQRTAMINSVFANQPKVEVHSFEGLTVDFCKKIGATYILRGLRDSGDFSYEKRIAVMNQSMNDGLETIFLLTDPALAGISSTILREILRNNGDISPFVPLGMKIEF